MNEYTETFTFQDPPRPRWRFMLGHDSNIFFNVPKAPNWFHRQMQRFLLGIIWERL